MTADARTPLDDAAFMQAFLDLVIPPSADGKMPGAGSLGIAATVAAGVDADVRLGPHVRAGLLSLYEAAGGPGGLAALPVEARVELVRSQAKAHPMFMVGVARHLYPAYYQHPRVLEGLGEPPRAPFPEGFEVEATDVELLAKLRPRGR